MMLYHNVPEAMGLRIISISIGMALLVFLGAWTIVHDSRFQLLNAHQAVAVLLALHGTLNLARAAQTLLEPVLATDM